MSDVWLGIAKLALHLDYEQDHVAKRIVTDPTFPTPARIKGIGHPRWRQSEVDAWMEGQRV